MKKLIFLGIITSALILILSTGLRAQTNYKFGHIDFATLYSMMPGLDSVKEVFSAYNKAIQEQFMAMQNELENKFMDYQSKLGTMSDIIRSTKEAEINDLKDRMDAFEVSATQDLQNKEMELSSPIIEKARKAVREVASEGNYTYIFNSAEGLLLFTDGGEDIMDKVKSKLGITVPTPAKRTN
jgi:outer membrane protein